MQNTSKVQQGQSFIDLVCQLSGSYEEVVNASILNGRSITDPVEIDTSIAVNNIRDTAIVTAFAKKQPATELAQQNIDAGETLDGIGYWIINKTFIVQ